MTAKLRLGPITDDKPVKLTVELPASLHADLALYARLLADAGDAPIEPGRLIVPMLQRFIAADRAFLKARRQQG
ncbi:MULTISPECIES: DUF2274 domain-containing protein [Sphingobium]|uniref:DUF2274 domain-containing protein n=1 Tax=Sphingobium sp. MI1205 TaxID=407020 RepID=UPI00076FFBD4|nr:DUF2274 domain-containing protein [Sphingobium sp. MI1205]AMK18301.1 hypothetical protein K663_09605 [Sphingobium sp. MI1205]